MTTNTDPCDICGKPILPDEPHYGGSDEPRHWDCHVKKNGEPDPFGLKKLDRLKNDIDDLRGKVEDIQRQAKSGRFSSREPNFSNTPKSRGPGPVDR